MDKTQNSLHHKFSEFMAAGWSQKIRLLFSRKPKNHINIIVDNTAVNPPITTPVITREDYNPPATLNKIINLGQDIPTVVKNYTEFNKESLTPDDFYQLYNDSVIYCAYHKHHDLTIVAPILEKLTDENLPKALLGAVRNGHAPLCHVLLTDYMHRLSLEENIYIYLSHSLRFDKPEVLEEFLKFPAFRNLLNDADIGNKLYNICMEKNFEKPLEILLHHHTNAKLFLENRKFFPNSKIYQSPVMDLFDKLELNYRLHEELTTQPAKPTKKQKL